MLESNLPRYLPSAEELPDSDEAQQAEQRVQQLTEQLRALGINPNNPG